MNRTFRRARARLAMGVLLLHGAVLALLLAPSVADAHARLERSDPAQGATLVTAPLAIRLWFSEQPQLPFTHVRLVGADGREIPLGAAAAIAEHGVALKLGGALTPGAYTIHWQTGGADGHPTRGEIAFRMVRPQHDTTEPIPPAVSGDVRPSAAAPAEPPEEGGSAAGAPSPSQPNEMLGAGRDTEPASQKKWVAMRWMELVAMLVVLGAVGFRLAVLDRWGGETEDASDAARRYAQPALVLLVLAAFARLAAESVAMHGAKAYEAATVHATLLQTTWGRGWLVGVAGALVAALGFALAGRRMPVAWGIAALGCLMLALGASLTGHAMASEHRWLAVPVDALHVVAAGTWLGGVLMLALVGIPCARRAPDPWGAARRLVVAFNPLAIGAATIVVLTGIVSAWLRLGAPAMLVHSHYGRVLVLKLAAVAVVAAIGFYNWRRVTPALGDERGTTRIRRGAALEALCAAAVLAITALLIVTPLPESQPPRDAVPTATLP